MAEEVEMQKKHEEVRTMLRWQNAAARSRTTVRRTCSPDRPLYGVENAAALDPIPTFDAFRPWRRVPRAGRPRYVC